MSAKNEKNQEMLEEKVVVKENQTTDLVEVNEEPKKFKLSNKAKKGLKVAGVLGVGFLGYLLGTKVGKKNDYYYDSDVIEGEIVDSDVE